MAKGVKKTVSLFDLRVAKEKMKASFIKRQRSSLLDLKAKRCAYLKILYRFTTISQIIIS